MAEPRAVHLASQDGTNAIIHRASSWCHNNRCGPETTFPFRVTGMTTTYPRGAAGAAIQEADVELNGVAFQLTGAAAGGAGQGGSARDGRSEAGVHARWSAPLESVLVHEIGHVLGLPDVCLAGHRASGRPLIGACGADDRARAMFPTGFHAAVAPADVAELCRLYPPEARGAPRGAFFAVAGALLAIVLVGVALARRRGRRAGRMKPS